MMLGKNGQISAAADRGARVPDELQSAVVMIVGPTGVGKSEIALRVAQDLGGEVVSLDSRLIYRGMDIGTAKPTPAERAAVPHHLIDITDPDRPMSLSEVTVAAYAAIDGILARGKVPVLAGGTGQYVRAIRQGWVIPEVVPDWALRAELEAVAEREGAPALHRRLAEVDPVAAARIDARNVRRVIRALEVYRHTGEPISRVQERSGSRYRLCLFGLLRSREDLYARIDRRIDGMIAGGLEAEVRALVAAGYSFDLPAMSGLGYGEWRAYFDGTIDQDEAVRLIRRNTRRLVRNQGTWFRRDDPQIHWLDMADSAIDLIAEVASRCAANG